MERSFNEEIESLKLGDGETFHGEGILAVTKALLQSGVSYVGGYQGAPVSHLLDVMVQARDYMDELGVHVEACTNEASAAAMLGASINYPMRGAVTWKSIVGTNVASDALSYLSTAGVLGGALIVVGEDYGEGASVALGAHPRRRAQVLDVDARPAAQPRHHREHGREGLRALGGVEHAGVHGPAHPRLPRARQLRRPRQPRARRVDAAAACSAPPEFDYERLSHPPATFRQEKLKADVRLPAARKFIREHKLNELFDGSEPGVGIVCQGGLYNNLLRALQLLGLADDFGARRIPILALNVVYPLVPEEITGFCAGKRGGAGGGRRPARIHRAGHRHHAAPRAHDIQTKLHGKDVLMMAGEYTAEVIVHGLARFLAAHARAPGHFRRDALARGGGRARARARPSCSARRCRRGRRISASAAPSVRCSPRSNWSSATSASATSRPTSAATRSRPSRRFRWAIPSSATA